jgi:hypothetical protein
VAFVRQKRIGGKPYAYLVENHWENGRARQSVTKYLGRVHEPQRGQHPKAPTQLPADFQAAVNALVEHELGAHGFERKDGQFMRENIVINPTDWSVSSKGKPAVVKLNDGYFCSHTVKELSQFSPSENEQQSGVWLARRLVDAGLNVPQETFVALFDQVMPKEGKQ